VNGCREVDGGKRRQLGGKETRGDSAEIKMTQGIADCFQRILTHLQHWWMDEREDKIEGRASKEPST